MHGTTYVGQMSVRATYWNTDAPKCERSSIRAQRVKLESQESMSEVALTSAKVSFPWGASDGPQAVKISIGPTSLINGSARKQAGDPSIPAGSSDKPSVP